MSYTQASGSFGSRQIAPKGKPSSTHKQKSNRSSKNNALDIYSQQPRLNQSDLNTYQSDDSSQEEEDLNDYLMNMKDDMTQGEMEEYLMMMQNMGLSDEDEYGNNLVYETESDNTDSVDSIDSDEEYWEGDNFDSDSSSEFDFQPKSNNPAQFGKKNRLNVSRHPNSQVKVGGMNGMNGMNGSQTQSQNVHPKISKHDKKEIQKQKRDIKKEKKQILKTNLEKGKKTLNKLYRSGDKYDAQVIEIVTKANKDIHDFVNPNLLKTKELQVVRSDNDHFVIAPLPDIVRNLVKKLATYYGLKPKVIKKT